MKTVRDIVGSIEEAKKQPRGEASKSFVLLTAVQSGLEKALKGWKLNIEGVRAGERKGGADESDDFTLYAYGPNREHVLVNSSNNAEEHVASADVSGEKHIRKAWERVERGYAKQIVAWVLSALPKAGIQVQESAPRTVADMLDEESDPADVAAGMIEKPEALLRVLRKNMEQVEKSLATASSRLAGSRKAGAGATQAVDLVREYLVTPFKHLKETADLAYGAVMKVAK